MDHQKIFRDFQQISDKIIFFFDLRNRRFLELNPVFEQITGLSIEKTLSDPSSVLKYVHPEDFDYLGQKLNELREGAVKTQVEFRIVLTNLTQKWICLSAYVTEHSTDEHIIAGVAEDVTNQKEHLLQLLRINSRKNSTMENFIP